MQKIKSIELPDVQYRLTKRSALNKKAANIGKGTVTCGALMTNPIKLGYGVSCGNNISSTWFTTPVTKIRVLKNKIVFHTENSIYELEELHDSKNP